MLKIEIELWPILYGFIFFLFYMIFSSLMKDNINKRKNVFIDNNKNNKKKDLCNKQIECSCQTFYIDPSELLNCDFCVQNHEQYIQESRKKRTKCLSFPV